jgi:SOS regulatory protein LexA
MKKEILQLYAQKLHQYYLKARRMPTYSEMLGIFGLRSKNAAHKRIAELVRRGYLEKDARGRVLPVKLHHPVKILGSVAAGFPSPAEEERVDLMSLDEYLISNPQATYLLKVEGDSMIGAGIMPGDLVLVQRGKTVANGDIVVACVDSEWTLKYFQKNKGKVVLIAANKKYPPIEPRQELVIAGVVIANVRKYK